MVSLKLLEAFYWVATLRSFHAAADRLRLTQPSVSYRVKELEASLGRLLFVRTGRTIRLTAQGQLLLKQADTLITAAQDLDRYFQHGGPLTGALRLGVTDAFAAICLPSLLRTMGTVHPDLDVAVVVDHSHVLTRALQEGSIDLAVLSTPPMLSSLRYELIGQQAVGWVSGPASGRARRNAAWIAGSRVFATPPPSNLDNIMTAWFASVGLAKPRLSFCNSMSAIIGLIEAGAGIGILPLRLAEPGFAAGTLRRLDVAGTLAAQAIYIAYSRGLLDAVLPRTIVALRAVIAEQQFCQ